MVSGASQSVRAAERNENRGTLPRRLGVGPSIALIVGFIIGSGIFRSPSRVALESGSTHVALLAWALGGAIALAGSLSLAELGAIFPRAGGVYVFLYEAYGPAVAFLKGWVYLIIGPSAWAALALVFAEERNRDTAFCYCPDRHSRSIGLSLYLGCSMGADGLNLD